MAPLDPSFASAFAKVFPKADSLVFPADDIGAALDLGPILGNPDAPPPPGESLPRVTLVRPADLVWIQFRFFGLDRVELRGAPHLVRSAGTAARNRPAHLVAVFGPQHLMEQAFYDAGGARSAFLDQPPEKVSDDPAERKRMNDPAGSEQPHPPVRSLLSWPSRVAYLVTGQHIPFSEAGLLAAMRALPLSTVPHAAGAIPSLRWEDLAGRVDAVRSVVARVSALGASVRRRMPRAARAGIDTAASRSAAGRRRDLERIMATDAALAQFAELARLERTASELEARFGAAAAVAAVATDLRPGIELVAGIDLGPLRPIDTRPIVREPTALETALELPTRLALSPHRGGAFAHAIDEVAHEGRVELWHSRLGSRRDAEADAIVDIDPTAAPPVDEQASATRTVRAVWTRDFGPGSGPAEKDDAFPTEDFGDLTTLPPFRAGLSARDRMQLVHLTSNQRWSRTYRPQPVPVEHLMLTSIGGWLAAEVHLTPPKGLSIEEWRHRTTMGRDHYVKVVYQGVLLPFGHRASLIKVTERRVKADGFATLYQRLFVVVRQPERRFLASGHPEHDHVFPFRWVRILTPSTPPLALPDKLLPAAKGQIFVPAVATEDAPTGATPPVGVEPFRFRMLANDVANHVVEFEGPLVFVEKTVFEAGDASKPGALSAANTQPIVYDLRGQRVAYAVPESPDDTTLATSTLRFQAFFDTKTTEKGSNFVLPALRVASAVVPAMSAFTGQREPALLTYATAYRAHGFAEGAGQNRGGLFLQRALPDGAPNTAPDPMQFGRQSDRSGAFVSPSVAVTALARVVGPVGGSPAELATLAGNPSGFDAGALFGGLDGAKLFGVLPLAELLPATGSPLPAFVAQSVNAVVSLQQVLTQAQAFANRHLSGIPAGAAADLLDVKTAGEQLGAAAGALASAILAFAAKPHPDQPFEQLLDDVVDTAAALRTRIGNLGHGQAVIPRPAVEGIDAAAQRIAALTGMAPTVAGLIRRFYTGGILPEQVSARLEWETQLVDWPNGAAKPVFRPEGDRTLRLTSEVQVPLHGTTPTALVSCSLPPLTLRLFGPAEFIAVHVQTMEFSVRPGRKPDVNVVLRDPDGIEFLGPLAFVEALKTIIPLDGFSDPPYLDVQPSGLKAGFDLELPDLAMGVFALSNIHVGAELAVPFIGESLEFRFFFATRENPFRLQVAFFAGGGFLALTLSPAGLRVIEAAFEFGAAVAMSFVVASGSISVMAGIYFRLEVEGSGATETQSVQLTGYFRARGEVDVLGLISAAIELYLELSYRSISGPQGESAKAVGKASISIEVSVCFVSFSVSVSCEKQFAGSKGDPTFRDAMGEYRDALGIDRAPWAEYCAAFATETA